MSVLSCVVEHAVALEYQEEDNEIEWLLYIIVAISSLNPGHQPMVRNETAMAAGLSEEQEKWNMVVQEYNEYRK